MNVSEPQTPADDGLRIAVVNLTRGGLSGGSRKYVEELVPRLAHHPLVRHVRLFLPAAINAVRLPPEMDHTTWPVRDELIGYRHLRAGVGEMEPHVVFIPTARWLNFGAVPTVAMVRNMEPLVAPVDGNGPSDIVRNLARRQAARTACRRATRVIAVSESVRHFLMSEWGVSEDKVGVVYHGVTPVTPSADEIPVALSQDPTQPFIFAAGSIRPARGLEDAVVALRQLRDLQIRCSLVVAGQPSTSTRAYQRRISTLARELGVADLLTWAGQLRRSEMAWCFRHSLLFVTTSRMEACPNTLLEAMSFGCLCVASDVPPMREFLGSLGVYYSPGDGIQLARRLAELVAASHGSIWRTRRAVAERALEFSWERTVQGTVVELARASAARPLTGT
jgi:glycosyltransferase involved in cell wall biosynthesis